MRAVAAVAVQLVVKIEVLVVAVSAVTEPNHMLVVKLPALLLIQAVEEEVDIILIAKILLVVLVV